MGNWFTNLLSGAAGYYNADEAAKAALELGERGAQEASKIGEDIYGRATFKPFTVSTGLSTATTTPEGGYSLGLSPEQQALQTLLMGRASEGFADIGKDPRQQKLLSRADTAFGQAFADPTQARADVYQQLRAAQQPEEQRQALALEERMLSQGRLGLSSDAYGGATPEMLAQAKAREEAMATAGLRARQQVGQEQQQAYAQGLGLLGQASGMRAQDLAEATGLLGAGYTPQTMALNALGMGTKTAGLADIGRRTGAELFGQLGQSGLEMLMQGAELASGLEAGKRTSLTEAILGRQPTIPELIAANQAGMSVEDISNLGSGNMLESLGFGDAPTPQWIKDIGESLGF